MSYFNLRNTTLNYIKKLSRDWGTLYNKRTHKKVDVPDISQIAQLRFKKLVPIDSIISYLKTQSFIKYAMGPEQIKLCSSPNDPLYQSGTQWSLNRINAVKAWAITKGNNIIISVNDTFTGSPIHNDLVGNVISDPSGLSEGHGGAVAGIAGAVTNNNIGVASLGWNDKIMLDVWGYQSIISAINQGADVINLSWITTGETDDPYIRNAINTALLDGVICVAAAGNQAPGNVDYIPSVQYPAAYNFGSIGQVIAVSGTQWDGTNETFVDGWNYSPGLDPINDPTDAFIDVSAPGDAIETIALTNIYTNKGRGTSDSAPFVSALCALILSINHSLTPNQVYSIITKSADKIGQYSYNSNGWNRYMGYGRINAYNALKYTIEHYGGTIAQSFSIPSGETWNVDPGITINFASGVTLTVNGVLNCQGTSINPISFNVGSIIFDGAGASSSNLNYAHLTNSTGIQCINGANVTIQNSTLNNCTYGVYIYNSAPTIKNNYINEPQQNGIYGETGGYQPYIYNNVLTKTSSNSYYHNYQGLYFYSNSAVYADLNDISGFYWGAYIGGGSDALFYYSSKGLYPYNRFRYNLYGIAAGYSSTITANWATGDGGNSIYNNSYYDAYCYNNSSIYGQKNYWGGGQPNQYVDGTSYLYLDPVLTSDPWNQGILPKIAGNSASPGNQALLSKLSSVSSVNDSNLTDIYTGLRLENEKKIDQAIEHYQTLISKNRLVSFSLTELLKINHSYPGKNIENYFTGLLQRKKHITEIQSLIADIFLQKNEFSEAIKTYDDLITNYPKDYESTNARFEELFAYLNIKKDTVRAKKILSEIKSMNLKDKVWQMRLSVAENLLNNSTGSLTKPNDNYSSKNKIPQNYALNQNYPNPFNPTTTISYQIPKQGFVNIIVYDILGDKVETLVNREQQAGKYSVQFNASNLSSGIYFYTIRVNNFTSTKKLLLLK